MRRFATVACRDLTKSDVLKRNGKYLEILSSSYVQKGEGQGMHIEFMDLQTHKRGKLHFKSSESAETTQLDSYPVEIESLDTAKGIITVSDSRHNRFQIPLGFASWAKQGVKVGTLLNLILEGDSFVKLSLPSDLKISR